MPCPKPQILQRAGLKHVAERVLLLFFFVVRVDTSAAPQQSLPDIGIRQEDVYYSPFRIDVYYRL
jgi:hypothetical protein